jgi:hypothetical protein
MRSGPSKSEHPSAVEKSEPENQGPASAQLTINAPPSTAHAHAFLSQRMAALAQERNSRWHHILKLFTGKPEVRRDD